MSRRTISPSDIEEQLRALETEMETASGAAKPAGITLAAIVVAGAVGVAYFAGHRSAKKSTTTVEIRRS